MAFNPDNFQFEAIQTPEEYQPILEWDALHRFIVIRVPDDTGGYTYQASQLSKEVNQNLHDGMPDEWSHENDRIVTFAIWADGEYTLDKEKLKFDFATKKTKRVRYEYKGLTETSAVEMFNVIKAAVTVSQLDARIGKSKAVLDLAARQSFLSQLDEERQATIKKLNDACNWTQLADATDSFTDEIALWTTYRAWLRDNNRQVGDFDDPLDFLTYEEEYRWPIDPIEYHRDDPEHATEYLSVPEHFSRSPWRGGVTTVAALEGSIESAAKIEKQIAREGGVPVSTLIWRTAEQYNLTRGLENLNIDNVRLTEG